MTALLLAACSGNPTNNDASADAEQPEVQAFGALFANGFKVAEKIEPASEAAPDDGQLGYAPNAGIRRRVARQLADNHRRLFSLDFALTDAEDFFRSGAAADIADRKLEALGLPTNSLAGANVLLFGLAWELANGEALTIEGQKGLLAQVNKQLNEGPMKRKGDAERQEQAEIRLQTAALWLEEERLRRNDAQRMQQLSDAVQRDMKRISGNDMRAHKLGGDGLVER
ncbi:hypothetical protein FHS96_001409 [Sphingomonas zeicaulis]|uniref:hypothetical protein n=1 Tax=Sphingomonas zeicaulis TaxID=1632740 RepID=UPI003D2060EF